MASLLSDSRTCYIAGGVLATCVVLVAVWHYMKRRTAQKAAERRKAYPANTVILHQFSRGPYAPSMSPFPLKLETYLRMEKIPYQNEHGMEMSSKGKIPWITFNGEDIDDSQFSIEYLNKKLDKDPNNHLNEQQRAVARAMQQMAEQSLYWVLILKRWVYNDGNWKFMKSGIPLPEFVLKRIAKHMRSQAHGQGYGRHTAEEVRSIEQGDLQALSDYLGTKPFLMGDQPCQEDCGIFGMLAQFKFNTTQEKKFNEEFPNLSDYCERMKDRFWPDWDECHTSGATKEATK